MKTKKWLTPALIALTPIALTPALLTTVSCDDVKTEKVATVDEFLDALEDESVKVIKLTDDLNFEDPEKTNEDNISKINIKRSVKIDGNGNTITWNDTVTGMKHRLVNINKGKKKSIDVEFEDLNLVMTSSSTSSAVMYMEDIQGSEIEIDNCDIKYDVQNGSRYYGITIDEHNLSRSEIEIDDSSITGYCAIFNRGSNVKLDAEETDFIGINDNSTPGIEDFCAIVLSSWAQLNDYPNKCYGANNEFKLKDNCNIYTETKGALEYFVSNRSASHNDLILDNTVDYEAKINGATIKDITNYFKTAIDDTDNRDMTDELIAVYEGSDMPREVKEAGTHDFWLKYYQDKVWISNVLGIMDVDKKPEFGFGTIVQGHEWEFKS